MPYNPYWSIYSLLQDIVSPDKGCVVLPTGSLLRKQSPTSPGNRTVELVQQDEVRAEQLLADGVSGLPLCPVNQRSRDVREGDEEVDFVKLPMFCSFYKLQVLIAAYVLQLLQIASFATQVL